MSKQTLHTIGEYKITSEKNDECLPEWWGLSVATGISLFIFSLIFATTLIAIYLSDAYILIKATGVALLGGLTLLFFAIIPHHYKGCGVTLCLWHLTKGNCTNKEETDYKFTKDPDGDTEKINQIVAGMIHKANRLIEEQKKEEDEAAKKAAEELKKSEECCVQYKERIGKVKKDA